MLDDPAAGVSALACVVAAAATDVGMVGGKRGRCEQDQEQEGKGGRSRSWEPEQQGSKGKWAFGKREEGRGGGKRGLAKRGLGSRGQRHREEKGSAGASGSGGGDGSELGSGSLGGSGGGDEGQGRGFNEQLRLRDGGSCSRGGGSRRCGGQDVRICTSRVRWVALNIQSRKHR